MRRVLVLLIAMGGLLAVPALALAHSDLSLVKVVDHAQAAPGDLLTYTIVIQNHGTHANAPGTVTDTLPAHTTFVSASGGCTAAAGVITCPIAPLAVGLRLDHGHRARRRRRAGGRSRQHRRRHGARRHADHQQPRRGHHDGRLRRPRRLRLVGSEPRRPAGRRRARLRAASRCISTTPPARSWARRRPTPTASTASTGCDRGRPTPLPRRAGRQRGRRAARGLRADRRERRQRRRDRLRRRAAQRRRLHRRRRRRAPRARSSRPTTSASGSRPRSATASGRTPTTTASRTRASTAWAVSAWRCTTRRAPRSRHAVTDANGLYLFDRLPAGHLQRLLRGRHDPARLQPHDQGRDRLDARQRLRRGRRRLRRQHGAGARPARSGLGRRHLEDAAPPSGGGSSTARSGQAEAGAEEDRQARDGARRRGVHYTLVVKNVGKATAHDVKVCDTLPDGVTVTSTGGGKLSDGQVCWTVGMLPKGKHKQFTLLVKVDLTQRARHQSTRRSPRRATHRAPARRRRPTSRSRQPPRGGGRHGLRRRGWHASAA